MKVNEKMLGLNELKKQVSVEEIKVQGINKNIFSDRIKELQNENHEKKLVALLQKINVQGEKLSSNVDIKELKKYKKLVTEFLYETTSNSQKFNKQSFLDRRGRHKVYATVQKVNQELDELTKEVLKDEKDNINILGRIDDIKGLLLDIIL
jgi:uncharacterized protein YaaR (DUF327 family)